jgi:4-hydroxybenzoate polyprenyltransferase
MLRIVHPFPSILVALLTVAFIPLAGSGAPLSRYLALGLGMLSYQFAIGLVNDIADLPRDRVYKPSKPLARGAVSLSTARTLALGCILAGLLLTLALPFDAWLIGLAGLSCGLAYDLYLKRTQLSWLPLSLALPLVPAWVYVASDAWQSLLWWTFPLGAIMGLALHLANQAPDVAAGEDVGLAGRLGPARSRLLSLVLFGVAGAAVTALLGTRDTAAAIVAALVALVALAGAPTAARYLGHDGAFGVLAVGAAILAVLFMSAV